MADTKLEDLPEITAPDLEDLLYLVNGVGGATPTPVDRKVTLQNLRAALKIDPVGSMFSGMDNRHVFADVFGPDEGEDEEFDGIGSSLPAGWSAFNGGGTYFEQLGALRIDRSPGGGATSPRGALRAVPSHSAMEVYWHLYGLQGGSVGYTSAVFLHSSTNPNRIVSLAHFIDSGKDEEFWVSNYNSLTTLSGTTAGPVQVEPPSPHWFGHLVVNSPTDYDFFANYDGGCDFTVATGFNPQSALGGPVTSIGFGVVTNLGAHVGLEWMRFRNIVAP